jgi:hypothetical protein
MFLYLLIDTITYLCKVIMKNNIEINGINPFDCGMYCIRLQGDA